MTETWASISIAAEQGAVQATDAHIRSRSLFTLVSTSSSLDPTSSWMIRPAVTVGPMPSSMTCREQAGWGQDRAHKQATDERVAEKRRREGSTRCTGGAGTCAAMSRRDQQRPCVCRAAEGCGHRGRQGGQEGRQGRQAGRQRTVPREEAMMTRAQYSGSAPLVVFTP